MTNKRRPLSIKGRLGALELELKPKDKPLIVVWQSKDAPELFSLSGAPGELMTKQEALDKLGNDFIVLLVTYEKKPISGADLV